jgi:hypothetical protein
MCGGDGRRVGYTLDIALHRIPDRHVEPEADDAGQDRQGQCRIDGDAAGLSTQKIRQCPRRKKFPPTRKSDGFFRNIDPLSPGFGTDQGASQNGGRK